MPNSGISPLTPAAERDAEASTAREGYVRRGLVAIDQCVNVLTGGLPGETISSRWARGAESGKWWGVAGSKFLDLFQRDHGAYAQAGDLERAQEVEATEESSPGWR